jgi:hypothetical protein
MTTGQLSSSGDSSAEVAQTPAESAAVTAGSSPPPAVAVASSTPATRNLANWMDRASMLEWMWLGGVLCTMTGAAGVVIRKRITSSSVKAAATTAAKLNK